MTIGRFRFPALLLSGAFVLVCACADNKDEDMLEVFSGELTADIEPTVVGRTFTDTVRLTVDGSRYILDILDTIYTNNPPLCDSRGQVRGFGTNMITFTPDTVDTTGQCDARHVVQGAFAAIFRGDSLYMSAVADVSGDSVSYSFRLKQ
jgi:hypothetical protein